MNVSFVFLGLCGIAAPLWAQSFSASYSNLPATIDSAGGRATSSHYRHDGSAGGVGSLATSADYIGKGGYAFQLYDVIGLLVSSSPSTVNEGQTRQLDAANLLDDSTRLPVDSSSVAWSIESGPIISISPLGVATAAIVYASTPANVRGALQEFTATAPLTVLNVATDDFGQYAGDGLGDDWQVQYFGLPPNANAGPLVDPDRDGQTNAFEYTAGLIPTDATSVFRLHLEAVPAQPGQKRVIFSPRLIDRTYTVKAKPSLLTGTFTPLTSSSFSDNAQERTVTDLNATGATKFYHVEIVKP